MDEGQIVELTIEDISTEGQGIGRTADGMVVFAAGALPGDVARVELTKVKKHYASGWAVEILHASEFRRSEEWCPYQDACGGCPLGALEYGKQLQLKEQQVKSRLERIGGVAVNLQPIVGMGDDERYRNKAVMKVSTGGLMTKKGGIQVPVHEPRIGFSPAKSHEVTDCTDCRLQVGTAMAAAEATRQFMEEDHICSYDKRWDKGLMRQMTVRTAFGTGEVMVIYDINGKGIPNAAKLVEYLDDAVYEAGGSLESVVIRNDKKTETLAGKSTITDIVSIGGEAGEDAPRELVFEISANSFYQVNHDQMERLYGIVHRYCRKAQEEFCGGVSGQGPGGAPRADDPTAGASSEGEGPVVLDLYCGIGTIGLCVADIASHVHGIEIVKDAVTDANRNAVINGIVNATYTCGKAEELIPQWAAAGQGPWEGGASAGADIAILDPPRAGCRPQLLEAIAEASIPAVIYVSCDPATLARDVKLLHERGYELVEATPVDMFPNAGHVETVALIQKRKSN